MTQARISTTVDRHLLGELRAWSAEERLPLGRLLDVAIRLALRRRARLDVVGVLAGRRAGRPTPAAQARERLVVALIRRRGGRPLGATRSRSLERSA